MLYHKKCEHERHQPYLHLFSENCPEFTYLRHISLFVLDPNLSSENDEDLELFQDLLFEGPMGRIHIFYYEEMFKDFYSTEPKLVLTTLGSYLVYLNKLSSLFVLDAYHFIIQREDPILIDRILRELPFNLKMDFVRFSQKYPKALQISPKLKLFNLFS